MISLLGDCHAMYEKYTDASSILHYSGRKGMPIWDIELKTEMEELLALDGLERIYLSCGHPFMGCKKKDEILNLSENAFLEFNQQERGFFNKSDYSSLSAEDIESLRIKYLEYLTFFYQSR